MAVSDAAMRLLYIRRRRYRVFRNVLRDGQASQPFNCLFDSGIGATYQRWVYFSKLSDFLVCLFRLAVRTGFIVPCLGRLGKPMPYLESPVSESAFLVQTQQASGSYIECS